MPLTTEENALASRILLELSRSQVEAKKLLEQAEKELHERRVGEARKKLLSAASQLRSANSNLDELRKAANLQDPKEVRRGELVERLRKAQTDLLAARKRKEKLEADGESDANILAAVDQVIDRYQRQLTGTRDEMISEGWGSSEVAAALAS